MMEMVYLMAIAMSIGVFIIINYRILKPTKVVVILSSRWYELKTERFGLVAIIPIFHVIWYNLNSFNAFNLNLVEDKIFSLTAVIIFCLYITLFSIGIRAFKILKNSKKYK